uniref:Tetraspanin n=1 Tax=Trichobilharzia regenti TaxID=157069 RepID=A0AA85JLY1_TRIRE|nr:unnamed protein product [Trichobilharzia regenti]
MGFCKSSYGYKHLQIALIVSNIIILGCAICIIAVDGIFYYAVRVHSDNLHGTVKGIITCVAIVGCFMILVGFLGLFGACLHSADILSLYAVGLLCIVLLHLGTGIACLCYQLEMWNSLHLVISNAVKNYHSDKNSSVLLDKIHRDLQCCGARTYIEYGDKLPSSCIEDGRVYIKGCTDALTDFGSKFLITVIILVFSFISIEIVCIGLAISLAAYFSTMDIR